MLNGKTYTENERTSRGDAKHTHYDRSGRDDSYRQSSSRDVREDTLHRSRREDRASRHHDYHSHQEGREKTSSDRTRYSVSTHSSRRGDQTIVEDPTHGASARGQRVSADERVHGREGHGDGDSRYSRTSRQNEGEKEQHRASRRVADYRGTIQESDYDRSRSHRSHSRLSASVDPTVAHYYYIMDLTPFSCACG
ncbi:hypothetical protein CPC08DRAFT_707941 [Agrocybe pediades]|nr:hypothetical protein CPC08DRAFT_707941 [Agrocybe pediades]